MYRRRWTKPSQRKRNARRQSDCPKRLYKYPRKEEKRKGRIDTAKCRVPKKSKER